MVKLSKKGLNYKVLLVFAPVLILIGAAGFLIPADLAVTSGAFFYNIFHIVFGIIGVWLLILRNENYIRVFNLGFGLIDIYQAIAGYWHLFPEQYFQWTPVDGILHVVVGLILISFALYGLIYRA